MMDLRKKILNVTVKRTKRKKKKMRRVATTTRVTWMIMKIRCPRAVRKKTKRRKKKWKTVIGRNSRKSTRGRKRRRGMSSRSV